MTTLTIELFGAKFEVTGAFTPYNPGSPWEPPSDPEFEAHRVMLGNEDVTGLMWELYTHDGKPAMHAIDEEACRICEQRDDEDSPRRRRAHAYIPPVFCGA